MNQPIVFTISDVLWLAGAIVAIASAVNVVAKAIEKMRKPNKTQDARLAELEKRSKSDFERLERIESGNVERYTISAPSFNLDRVIEVRIGDKISSDCRIVGATVI